MLFLVRGGRSERVSNRFCKLMEGSSALLYHLGIGALAKPSLPWNFLLWEC